VVKDVAAGVVVAGNPARVVKEVKELVCFKDYFERPYVWRQHNRPE
jgi:serine acetyltransferase